jgi:hypothetical protein
MKPAETKARDKNVQTYIKAKRAKEQSSSPSASKLSTSSGRAG